MSFSIKKGPAFPTSSSGLTLAELAFETTNKTFHIGLGIGVTAQWIGAPITQLSSDIILGATYAIPTAKAIKNYAVANYVSSLGAAGEPGYTGDISIHQGSGISVINGGDNRIAITNIGVRSFNGLTGAVLFSNYVSLFNGRTGSVQGVSAAVAGTGISVSGATGAVTFTNAGVISINGSTGAITNVAKTNTTNTFTELQIFSHGEGLSASCVKTDNINTPLGILNIFDTRIRVGAFSSGVRFNGEDVFENTITTVLQPLDITADRTIYLPNASGTVALTSQLMGTVNGSTANTTAVTSFNGRTGAIQGVTAAIAGTGISVSGSTGTVIFTNTGVVSINGSTGSFGSLSSPVGYTSSIPVYTYPDGVTTYNAGKTPYYQPHWIILQDTTGYAVRANRTYFTLFNSHTSTNIKTIRFSAHNTVTTGNVYFSVWDANSVTGFPNTNLYTSESIAVASGFGKTSVTNSSGLVTVSAGNFYIAATFSSTPIIYAYSKSYRIPIYGAPDMISGYRIDYLVADTSTFTTPSSIYAAGVTFAGVDYHPTTYTGPRIEYAPVI